MLVDDAGDPGLRTLEMLAVKTIKEGWQGRVTCQHARAMALYPEPYYRKIEHLLKEASDRPGKRSADGAPVRTGAQPL